MLSNRRRLLLPLAATMLMASASAPAEPLAIQIQPVRLSASAAKQMAILGGASRLAAMTMQQGAVQPEAPAVETPQPLLFRPALASADSPDFFGTSALRISRTPLDSKWRRLKALPAATGSWSPLLRQQRSQDRSAQLEAVNRWVNARIAFQNDRQSADRWSSLSESVSRGRGDCEDYAIAKMQLLSALGFPAEDLYLAIVRDLVRRADHALLVVRLDGRFLVLDNNSNLILEPHQLADYRPVFTYSTTGSWIHGYRREVQYASLAGAPMAHAGR